MNSSIFMNLIHRSNRRLFLLCCGGALTVAVLVMLNKNYLYNFVMGPFSIIPEQVLDIPSTDDLPEHFVTITGDEVLDTGYSSLTHRNGDDYVEANFLALVIKDRLLLIKKWGLHFDLAEKSYTGVLVNMPSDVRQEVVNALIRVRSENNDVFLPLMLDTRDFRSDSYFAIAVGALVLLLCCYGLVRSFRRITYPYRHPLLRKLQRFGDLELIADQIDREMSIVEPMPGNVYISRNWLLKPYRWSFHIVHLDDLMWVYKNVTQRRTQAVPTGRVYAAYIYERHGSCITIDGREQDIDKLLEALVARSPWIVSGYDKQVEDAWYSDRAGFAAAVDRRRGK
jgi:hypothetical protein